MKEHPETDMTVSASYLADFSDSYSAYIGQLLQQFLQNHPGVHDEIQDFANSFYARLGNRREYAAILERLSSEELEHLKSKGQRDVRNRPKKAAIIQTNQRLLPDGIIEINVVEILTSKIVKR